MRKSLFSFFLFSFFILIFIFFFFISPMDWPCRKRSFCFYLCGSVSALALPYPGNMHVSSPRFLSSALIPLCLACVAGSVVVSTIANGKLFKMIWFPVSYSFVPACLRDSVLYRGRVAPSRRAMSFGHMLLFRMPVRIEIRRRLHRIARIA